jgi:tRNA modification GTPase
LILARDSIFALATAAGRAAIAVLRLSGPDLSVVLARLIKPRPRPRQAALRAIFSADGVVLDEALVLWFPAPSSFTGEDVLELHLHGGAAVVEAVTATLLSHGLRPAEPGEFTRRAFEAGRLELSQAEAVADLVDAETEAQRAQALAQLGGALRDRYERWRDILIEASAFLEAQIDFPDEDIPDDVAACARAPLEALRQEIEDALADHRGERVRDGLRIALIGAPNAGKSTLFNALIGRDAAIVTDIPGTTRDVIEAPLVIDGFKVLIADTAGLRDTTDLVEAEGVRRARKWADDADLRLHLVAPGGDVPSQQGGGDDLVVWTKRDLQPVGAGERPGVISEFSVKSLSVSALEPAGLCELRAWLKAWVAERMTGRDFPAVTQQRHRGLLREASEHLARALVALKADPELAAEDVRLAARALARLSGRVDVDDILDRVFSSFCIGK